MKDLFDVLKLLLIYYIVKHLSKYQKEKIRKCFERLPNLFCHYYLICFAIAKYILAYLFLYVKLFYIIFQIFYIIIKVKIVANTICVLFKSCGNNSISFSVFSFTTLTV